MVCIGIKGRNVAKKKSFEDLIGELRAEGQHIGTLAEALKPTEVWPTGNVALDSVLGVGGLPLGKIIELSGVSQAGKSTASLQAAAELQQLIKDGKEEGYILFLDYEHALDFDYCRALGLDVDHASFQYMAPITLEQGVNAYRKLLNAGYIRLCIVDSVAAMVSEKEAQADTGTVVVADRAKALYQVCRQILAPLQEHRSSIIFLNHMLEKIPTTPFAARFGKQYTTPGGNAIGYYASVRIEFTPTGKVKTAEYDPTSDSREDTETATQINAYVRKNKVAKPGRVAKMLIRYGKGFSQPYSVMQTLIAHGVVKQRTSVFEAPEHLAINGKKSFRGSEAVMLALEANPEVLALWVAEARKCIEGYTGSSLDEVGEGEYVGPDETETT